MRLLPGQISVELPSTLDVGLSPNLAARDTYPAKLFSSPVSCGLLTGVLAGGVVIWWQFLVMNAQEPRPGLDFVLDYLAMLCLCCGAVICRRKPAILPHVLGLAAIATCLDLSIEWMEVFGQVSWPFSTDPFVAFSISSALSGAFIGLVLAATYDCLHVLKSCVLLSVVGQLLTFTVLYLQERAGVEGGTEQAAHWLMPIVLTYMVSAALPVLAIDREWRARKQTVA
jgi:hypothetical protein